MRALLLLALIPALSSCIPEAKATPPLEVVQSVPAVGPGGVDSFSLSCTSAAAVAIAPPSGATMISYTCQNASSTMVQVGDSGIGDPGTTRNAPVYCTTCAAQEWGGNTKLEYCRGDTDTTIYCRALVAGPTL